MNAKLLGFFSGFPAHHFTDEINQVLRENLPVRGRLVFMSGDGKRALGRMYLFDGGKINRIN